jgi:K+-sensing histidine kinase KdpD
MVRVAVPTPSGRLRVIVTEGLDDGSGRLRSSKRRTVFRLQRPMLEPMGQTGATLGIFPVTHDGVAFGVVEVVGPTAIMQERGAILSAIVGQSGLVFSDACVQAEAESAVAGMNALLRLASELVSTTTATEVVRQTVKVCRDHLRVPVAGLLPDRDGWGWFLAASEGMSIARRAELRKLLLTSRVDQDGKRLRIPSLRAFFRQSVGCRDVVTIGAKSAVFFAGDVPGEHQNFLDRLSPLVSGALVRHGLSGTRSSRHTPSEMGIAWTAHELKAPLLGAQAALDLVSQSATRDEGQELLLRTRQELRQLSELIDPLLRWSSGTETLSRQYLDLVEVTRGAVASSNLGMPSERVTVSAPERRYIRGDPHQLRSAIANVVRNALAYSPSPSPVEVSVEGNDRSARVVVRDRGTGIPRGEREAIFEPFSRGRSSGQPRGGSGLGLFIARRVLEAHGGSIALRPSTVGATFELEIPVEEWQLSAS